LEDFEPTSSYALGEANEAGTSAGRGRSIIVTARKETVQLTPAQLNLRELSNEACWEKGLVAEWSSDPERQREVMRSYIGLQGVEGPRFTLENKPVAQVRAAEVGLVLASDTFVPETQKTTLDKHTDAPQKLGAVNALTPCNKRDNRKKRVKILHFEKESNLPLDIYGKYGDDHCAAMGVGEIDLYAGRRSRKPYLGLVDPDTGLLFPWSEADMDRYVN
jgi:hypothetical protein